MKEPRVLLEEIGFKPIPDRLNLTGIQDRAIFEFTDSRVEEFLELAKPEIYKLKFS